MCAHACEYGRVWALYGRDIDHRKYHNRIYMEPSRQRNDNPADEVRGPTPSASNKNAVNGQIIT